ncbi:MAG TPA: M20/M25/M40 family metallo-hydrolase [Bacillota bacterium]|nr:M20/M25/M40 family metallo-hydrolase [Bacillota bacterium]
MNINWTEVRDEAIRILSDLIRIKTVNPPGNESEAALYLQRVLNEAGIESTIYASASNRGNLVATLKGNGRAKPLVLLSHLDVVGANPSQWSHPPFEAEIDNGYIWGRGALDMKGMIAMELVALLLYKRSGQVPDRDLIMVAAADEEAGGNFGMEWLLEQDIPGLKNAEYVINEGGEGGVWNGFPYFSCQNGEKGVLWLKLTVKGTPGHASMPGKDNAIVRMATIINRLNRHKHLMQLCATSRGFLAALALKRGLRLPEDSAAGDYSLKMFASRYFREERSVQAMLYNTATPTIIRAGEKTNVLAEACELTLDCRLLPGETPQGFLKELKGIVNDPDVEYEIIQTADPTESDLNTRLYEVMEEAVRKIMPEAALVPYLSPGGTDSRYFRQRGITAYGFMPVIINESELQRMHGIDERLSLDNLELGTKILYEVLQGIANS